MIWARPEPDEDAQLESGLTIARRFAQYWNAPAFTIERARTIIDLLHNEFRGNGYLLAMYGSVARHGQGRDLDLLAVPWRPGCAPPYMMENVLFSILRIAPVSEWYDGQMRTKSRVYKFLDGALLDIQFRLPWEGQ